MATKTETSTGNGKAVITTATASLPPLPKGKKLPTPPLPPTADRPKNVSTPSWWAIIWMPLPSRWILFCMMTLITLTLGAYTLILFDLLLYVRKFLQMPFPICMRNVCIGKHGALFISGATLTALLEWVAAFIVHSFVIFHNFLVNKAGRETNAKKNN